MSNGDSGTKWMQVGHKNRAYGDATGHIADTVTTNDDGWAEFRCPAGKVSVWTPQAP